MLGYLYSTFPSPSFVSPTDYVEHYDESNPISREVAFLNDTLCWLQQAGYISFNQIRQNTGGASGAVLTAKGLEALRAVPQSLSSKASLGERLAGQAKSGSGEAIKALVGEVVGLAARGALSL